jgi:hypothetical protein
MKSGSSRGAGMTGQRFMLGLNVTPPGVLTVVESGARTLLPTGRWSAAC